MINGNRVLALIPARGGSKGIKHKNIVSLGGKPLIGYSIEAAKGCQYIDCVVVSTDDEEIREIAQKYGAEVPFMRPKYLSEDNSKTIEVILHAIDFFSQRKDNFDIVILLQPTSPLRDSDDITEALNKFINNNSRGLVSISEVETNPLLIRKVDSLGNMVRLLDENSTCRRQEMKRYYCVNGSIYINWTKYINNNTSLNDNEDYFIMNKSHSIDIDEPKDLVVADYYLNNSSELSNVDKISGVYNEGKK